MSLFVTEMLDLARKAMANAYNPYSNYAVGACLRTVDNQLFAGCNCENASYSMTICAETAAISSMITQGQQKIAEILVMADRETICSPCGACRQRIFEFAIPDCQIHLGNNKGVQKSINFASLLPEAFKFHNQEN